MSLILSFKRKKLPNEFYYMKPYLDVHFYQLDNVSVFIKIQLLSLQNVKEYGTINCSECFCYEKTSCVYTNCLNCMSMSCKAIYE